MKSKFVILGIFLLLVIGGHFVAAHFISSKIENIATKATDQYTGGNIDIGDVSVHPFRGNVYFNKVSMKRSPTFSASAKSLGTDLSYWYFWSLLLQDPSDYDVAMKQLNLRAYSVAFNIDSLSNKIEEVAIQLNPLSNGRTQPDTSFLKLLKGKTQLDISLKQVKSRLHRRMASNKLGSISPSSLYLDELKLNAIWNGSSRQVDVQQLEFGASHITGTGSGIIEMDKQYKQPQISSLTYSISYADTFEFDADQSNSSFSGTNLRWTHQKSSRDEFLTPKTALLEGQHSIRLEQFKWNPSQKTRQKIQSLTGGIGIPGSSALTGDSLKIDYNYNIKRELLTLHQLAFRAPAFSLFGRGKILIEPHHLGKSYIQNGEVRVHKLSDKLKSTLQQFEEIFDMQILDPASQSIRIYLQGNLKQPDWKLL